ncbi:cell division protein ZapA [Candidatus Vondammii sp. HM_W22]|uniref:cell division protein ZapA n=1 Tax=Candidatus Vondammii sp. HM_W22 TaxID=2687299 RepID=UPI001F13F7D0|nr:cell division protein ZapA [Candidatus Vondammii sp. HM_W22]
MTQDSIPVTVHILEKEYRVVCPREEEQSLLSSAQFLDEKMREIRSGRKIIGTDRIAVMAALNIAHALLEHKNSKGDSSKTVSLRLRNMQDKIEVALHQENQLEF